MNAYGYEYIKYLSQKINFEQFLFLVNKFSTTRCKNKTEEHLNIEAM